MIFKDLAQECGSKIPGRPDASNPGKIVLKKDPLATGSPSPIPRERGKIFRTGQLYD